MSEWWTYRPVDLLMFAPRTYWRLFELHNETLWPLQVSTTLAGMALGLGLMRGSTRALRAGAVGLALCWALVAWAFLWRRYAPIQPVAAVFAIAFGVQALGLLALCAAHDLRCTGQRVRRGSGLALLVWALLAHPLLALAAGRPLAQAELFGLAPDPTVIASLGLLLCAQAGRRATRALLWALRLLALAWCLVSAATLWTMGSPQGWVPLAAAALTLGGLWHRPHRRAGARVKAP